MQQVILEYNDSAIAICDVKYDLTGHYVANESIDFRGEVLEFLWYKSSIAVTAF